MAKCSSWPPAITIAPPTRLLRSLPVGVRVTKKRPQVPYQLAEQVWHNVRVERWAHTRSGRMMLPFRSAHTVWQCLPAAEDALSRVLPNSPAPRRFCRQVSSFCIRPPAGPSLRIQFRPSVDDWRLHPRFAGMGHLPPNGLCSQALKPCRMELRCEQTVRSPGVCEPALEPHDEGEGSRTKGQDSQPDLGNSAVRHYRGPPKT